MTREAFVVDELVCTLGGRGRRVRFSYSRTDGNCLHFVIVDIAPDGQEDWAEQESGELRWHSFNPPEEDRQLVQRWLDTGYQPSGWELLVVPPRRRKVSSA